MVTGIHGYIKYHLPDIYKLKIAIFTHCILTVDPSGGTPSNINEITEKYI